VDVEDAFLRGADYIVVGRPIRQAADPRAKAEEIQAKISGLFGAWPRAGDSGEDGRPSVAVGGWKGMGLIPCCRHSAMSTMEYCGVPRKGSVDWSSLVPSAAAAANGAEPSMVVSNATMCVLPRGIVEAGEAVAGPEEQHRAQPDPSEDRGEKDRGVDAVRALVVDRLVEEPHVLGGDVGEVPLSVATFT
jgi:hypothetical protein